MFNWFKKSPPRLTYRVWMTEVEKNRAILQSLSQGSQLHDQVWMYLFEDCRRQLELMREASGKTGQIEIEHLDSVIERLGSYLLSEKHLVLCEIPPLPGQASGLAKEFGETERLTCYTSLESPIFDLFGGQRIRDLMKTMGAKENEMIAHNLIDSSILKAQEKVEKSVKYPSQVNSSLKEWLEKNLGSSAFHSKG